MNQTELIARVRRNAFIPTNHPTYTDAVIIDELTDAIRSIYEDIVTIPRQGHWLKQYSFSTTVGQSTTRITPRAVVGGVEKVEMGVVNGQLFALDQVTENHAQYYESFGGRTGVPEYYCIRGDQIDFLPAFNTVMTVRISYYVRPSKFVPVQPNANYGLINVGFINVANRTVQPVNQPNTFKTGSPVALTTGDVADIIHPNGTFELCVVSAPITAFGAGIYTFAVGTDLSDVQPGDYLRGEAETDWPAIPEEFHRTVADTASVKIMLQLNQMGKAGAIAQSVGGDLDRLRKLIEAPRTRRQPKRVPAMLMTRGYWGSGWGL